MASTLKWGSGLDSDDRGMYGTATKTSNSEDSIIEEVADASSDELRYAILNGDNYTVYGGMNVGSEHTSVPPNMKVMSAEDALKLEGQGTAVPQGTQVGSKINPFFGLDDNGKPQILGLPFHFNKISDPDGRMFRNTIMADLPLLFVVPGKTVLNNKLVSQSGNKIKQGKLLGLLADGALDVLNLGIRGARSGSDLRFLGFKADWSEYYKYVQLCLSTVRATMGFNEVYSFSNEYQEGKKGLTGVKNHGLCFYLDKSSSITEGNSNDYTQTSTAQRANDLNAQNREAKLMLGINTGGDTSGMVKNALNFITKSVAELVEDVTSLTGIFSRAGNIFARVVNGSQLLYPEIWSDSSVDKSYTLTFKFYSPYGDKDSIFHYVYVPFFAWFCLSYPRQDSVMGYGQPFVMRVTCPGWFESSMCVVTNISFTKAAVDNLWTTDNLPQSIEVNVTLKDLYSNLPITKKYRMISYNIGLSSFLDTMAGIRTDQLDVIGRAKTWALTRLSIPSTWWNASVKGNLSDFGYNIQQKVNNFLR